MHYQYKHIPLFNSGAFIHPLNPSFGFWKDLDQAQCISLAPGASETIPGPVVPALRFLWTLPATPGLLCKQILVQFNFAAEMQTQRKGVGEAEVEMEAERQQLCPVPLFTLRVNNLELLPALSHSRRILPHKCTLLC